MSQNYTDLDAKLDLVTALINSRTKVAFTPPEVIAAGGEASMPPAGAATDATAAAGAPPMDPAMAGGAPPMDPAMAGGAPPMDPAMAGGAPPMDPAMAGGAPPMDPAMAGGAPPMDPAMMDPAMMDPAMMDPSMMEEPYDVEGALDEIRQDQKTILSFLAAIVDNLGIQMSARELLNSVQAPPPPKSAPKEEAPKSESKTAETVSTEGYAASPDSLSFISKAAQQSKSMTTPQIINSLPAASQLQKNALLIDHIAGISRRKAANR